MKYQQFSLGLVLGLSLLWGCAPSSPEVSTSGEINGVSEAEPAAEINSGEAATQPLEEDKTKEHRVTESVDESADGPGLDDADPASQIAGSSQVAEVPSTEGLDEAPEISQAGEVDEIDEANETGVISEADDRARLDLADVISVEVSGEPSAYRFSVGIASPDTGCQQYADWWEVLSEDGELIYRRVLAHSHVNEQPFVRSGGPVQIKQDEVVWVRAHMNPGGYGGTVFKGSVQAGFQELEIGPEFAAGAADLPPLPTGCGF